MSTRLPLPDGIGVALVTLFDRHGWVDVAATTDHAEACVARGARSILVAGTTGEPWRLAPADRIALASALKTALPDTAVLVGTGDPSGRAALAITEEISATDIADALVVLAPGDMAPTDFYPAIRAAAGPTPVMAYHLPALSPPGIPATELPSLDVDGIKDSSGDADRLAQLLHDGARVYVGSPNLLSTAGPCGAAGALLGLANTIPETCVHAWHGDADAQRRLFDAHLDSLVDFPTRLKPAAQP